MTGTMDFYDTEEGVSQYIAMAEGYDGRNLIEALAAHLHDGASILELGSGPGVDMAMLAERYSLTGSDLSREFLKRLKSRFPDADLLQLDAVTLDTARTFEAIYSNKVLHHLDDDDLCQSIRRQAEVLVGRGIVMHSFWYGDRVEEHGGMTFHYRDEVFLEGAFATDFEVLQMERYTEFEDNDSIFLAGRKRTGRP